MAARRYELSDAQLAKIASLLPDKAEDSGRTGSDNRLLWIVVLGVALWL
ncbi:hypothetical protein [Neorhizobium galegae]|nr:hypothetical protein [Neorhizobium galegae]MCM2497562.1 hypothetical protein [Neorhizobium galegae]MCQ1775168.1 hypothetical protein [Neorhizobium galegae]